jgi:phosphonate metabolism protein PhnN/1,5-bisphosphokinase (PRPP-forming)
MTRGNLLLVVGASGSGKDTLITGARAAFAASGQFMFPRREITRPSLAGGEDHVVVTETEYDARRATGAYALSWSAHGLHYGIPGSIVMDLEAGRQVVANVSRTVIDDARRRFQPVRVIDVRVSEQTLRDRLLARAREAADEIEQRVARASAYSPSGPDVVAFENEAPAALSIARFVALLERLAPASEVRYTTTNGLAALS